MFSFQDNPGGSLNPKDFWVENCNLNERYVWLNNQDIEPLWLSVEEVPGYPGTRSKDDAEKIVSWCWEVARSRWHYIWVDRNFNQQDREEIIFTAEDINKKLLELSFERKAEVDALIAENDALSVDRRLDALYSCLVIKRGAANLKLVRGLAPPAHFNAKKWFQHIALLLKAGGFESLATDAETFSMIVEFDVITEIGGANVLDKRATTTAPNTLATDGQASRGGHASCLVGWSISSNSATRTAFRIYCPLLGRITKKGKIICIYVWS